MKKTLIFTALLSMSTLLLSMDPATAKYYYDVLKNEPLGFLPNRGTPEIRDHIIKEAKEKYSILTRGWKSHCSSPLKTFEECTWYDIDRAWNGNDSGLICSYIPQRAKH